RRAFLAFGMAALQIVGKLPGIALSAELRLPAVGDIGQRWIEALAQSGDDLRQGCREILEFPAAEAMPRHHDAAAEPRFLRRERGERTTFLRRQKRSGGGKALAIEIGGDGVPIEPRHALGERGWVAGCPSRVGAVIDGLEHRQSPRSNPSRRIWARRT